MSSHEQQLFLFALGSLIIFLLAGRQLKNPGVHGFYRFFVFEGILALLLLNYPYWFIDPFSPLHIFSWILLALSIYFILASLWLLRRHGGRRERMDMPENFGFENTLYIVDSGLYRYIRHPMYGSLLLLGWGAFFKHPSVPAVILVFWITGFLFAAAGVEEKENRKFFGSGYDDYMRRSKMFIPWLF